MKMTCRRVEVKGKAIETILGIKIDTHKHFEMLSMFMISEHQMHAFWDLARDFDGLHERKSFAGKLFHEALMEC